MAYAPPTMVPVAQAVGVPAQIVAAPPTQVMSEPVQIFGALPGVLVRQRLRIANLCPCMLQNKYDIGQFPAGLDPAEPWEDGVFKHQRGMMYAEEHSDVPDKVCCGRWRKFNMSIHAGTDASGPEIVRLERPFKCPCHVCCYMPWPQEIRVKDPRTGGELGHTKQDWRLLPKLCGKEYWKTYDNNGDVNYVIERDICCNKNMCAPNCLCPIHRIDIKNADETEVVGHLENIFPGCSLRTLCFGNLIDNYRLTFPADATPHQKANLLAGLMLVDFMIFANADDDKNNQSN